MPLHIGDYHADTTHLTRDQHGAYILLLMAYWRRGGPLPADDVRLAIITKSTVREWSKLRNVMLEFFLEKDGLWYQKRADEELVKAVARTEAKAAAGKRGAAVRWQTNSEGNGKAMTDASNSHRQTDTSLPSTLIKNQESNSDISNDYFDDFYNQYPLKKAKRRAKLAYTAALKRAPPEVILAGVKRYANERQNDDPKFTKHPATWLNADGWLDEESPHYDQQKSDTGFDASLRAAEGILARHRAERTNGAAGNGADSPPATFASGSKLPTNEDAGSTEIAKISDFLRRS